MIFNGIEYLTVKELCQSHNINERQLRRWLNDRRENGLQKAIYVVNKRMFMINVQAFFEWFESRREGLD